MLNERLKDVFKPHLNRSIELFVLNRNNVIMVKDILGNDHMYNSIKGKLDPKYSAIIEEIMTGQHEEMDLNIAFVNGRYKPYRIISSKTIRLSIKNRNEVINPKFTIEHLQDSVKKAAKVKSIRLRNLMLRVLHGDIYTKLKLTDQGMIDDHSCNKCGQIETLEHLVRDCWYSARIWNRLIKVYKTIDSVPQNYQVNNEFVLGLKLNKARLTLHLEIIRLLQNKNRPTILPRMLLKQALENLRVCELSINDKLYYERLLSKIESTG